MTGGQDVLAEQLNGGFDVSEVDDNEIQSAIERGEWPSRPEPEYVRQRLCFLVGRVWRAIDTDCKTASDCHCGANLRSVANGFRHEGRAILWIENAIKEQMAREKLSLFERPAPLAVGLYKVRYHSWGKNSADDAAVCGPSGEIYRIGSSQPIGDRFCLNPGWTITETIVAKEV